MHCSSINKLNDEAYLDWLNDRVSNERIPLSGTIDLTFRCNMNCVHCYLADPAGTDIRTSRELSTKKWLNIIDEITHAGCLFLLLSGGEPLLRKDFIDIYRHAKLNGMFVSVFTNGTLITDEIIELFSDLPPQDVEISLYGATPETYERITGVKGSFKRCIDGIKKLQTHQIPIQLKTVLLKTNRHEFNAIREMADTFGADFRFDAALFPCFNGSQDPLAFRVTPEEAIEKELENEGLLDQWVDYYENMKQFSMPEALYQCGAGETNFYIDPFGNLSPCLMARSVSYNLGTGSFEVGWQNFMAALNDKMPQREFPCQKCEKRIVCDYCPGMFALETGAEDIQPLFTCEMGHARYNLICGQSGGK